MVLCRMRHSCSYDQVKGALLPDFNAAICSSQASSGLHVVDAAAAVVKIAAYTIGMHCWWSVSGRRGQWCWVKTALLSLCSRLVVDFDGVEALGGRLRQQSSNLREVVEGTARWQ